MKNFLYIFLVSFLLLSCDEKKIENKCIIPNKSKEEFTKEQKDDLKGVIVAPVPIPLHLPSDDGTILVIPSQFDDFWD